MEGETAIEFWELWKPILKQIIETALPLRIPVKADGDIGPDWGHVSPIVD